MQITDVNAKVERTVQLDRPVLWASSLLLLLLALAGCSVPKSADSWDPLQVPETSGAAPSSSGIQRSAERLSPAMADLIGRADIAIEQQQWSEASTLLERALRVNPKQAEAWTRMAVVNLGKNNPQQCIQMAKKSNRHAKTQPSLMSYNWLLISRAYEQLGQPGPAQSAMRNSRQIQDGGE